MGFSLSLFANQPISDHVASLGDARDAFPFLPVPYVVDENRVPLSPDARKK
jgi:hypothetical protein